MADFGLTASESRAALIATLFDHDLDIVIQRCERDRDVFERVRNSLRGVLLHYVGHECPDDSGGAGIPNHGRHDVLSSVVREPDGFPPVITPEMIEAGGEGGGCGGGGGGLGGG